MTVLSEAAEETLEEALAVIQAVAEDWDSADRSDCPSHVPQQLRDRVTALLPEPPVPHDRTSYTITRPSRFGVSQLMDLLDRELGVWRLTAASDRRVAEAIGLELDLQAGRVGSVGW